jgi:Glycosyltransferase family 87
MRWPGVRALGSARFRILLASILWLAGSLVLGAILLRQAVSPNGQYAFDFQVYYAAAGQIAAGHSPYDPSMFAGPIPAQGALLYKYPPLLAQLLVPLAGLPLGVAAGIWFMAQAFAVFAATWLAARAGGARNSAETFAWSAVATTYFLPVFDTLWKGNVSGILALAVAVALYGGAAGGAGVMAAALLKTTPVVTVLPALLAGRRALLGLIAGAIVTVSSFVLSPSAWFDFARVIPNLLNGPSVFPNNLAPDNLVGLAMPDQPLAAAATRFIVLGIALVALAVSVFVVRRAGGWPAALALAVLASLLLPGATWYHYLAVLLPLAAFAWPKANAKARTGLIAGGATVTLGLAALPVTVAGAALMGASALAAVWPREQAAGVAK